jgi:hypothetical protein
MNIKIKSSVSFSAADSGDMIIIEYEPVQNGMHGSKRDVKVLIEDCNGEKADALMSVEELQVLKDMCTQMLDFINTQDLK